MIDTKRCLAWLALLTSILLGCLVGAGGFTFVTAAGTAYLSDDPKACINCHIMREQFDGWTHASHHAVATCNDCHLPQENLFRKFMVKASNGYHHSQAFTFSNFAEPIRIRPGNAVVLESNCLRCHREITAEITAHGKLGLISERTQGVDLYGCARCHADVGHGPRR